MPISSMNAVCEALKALLRSNPPVDDVSNAEWAELPYTLVLNWQLRCQQPSFSKRQSQPTWPPYIWFKVEVWLLKPTTPGGPATAAVEFTSSRSEKSIQRKPTITVNQLFQRRRTLNSVLNRREP